jgi:hypothetical protein
MKNMKIKFIILFLLGTILVSNNFAQGYKKLAQSGFQFLSVVSDARASAMAEAMTSLQFGSSAMFFNPAGMTEMPGTIDLTASVNQWIADIKHNTFSISVKPFDGDYGVFGLSAQYVDYGDFYGTRVNRGDPKGYEDIGLFSLNAYAFGVGYAKALTDQFCIGGHVKYVHQDLGTSDIAVVTSQNDTVQGNASNTLSPFVFDFGTQFRPGIHSLVFGMSVRNFSTEVKYAEEGFQAPLVFTLGISMNVMDLFDQLPYDQSLLVAIDASHYRDHPEQVKIGLDYSILKVISLRAGFVSDNDESGLSYGAGISQFGFTFDYSYTPFGVFDKVQRLTARFTL